VGKSVRYRDRSTGYALGEAVAEGALKRVGWSTVTILEVLNSNVNQTEHIESLGEVLSSSFFCIYLQVRKSCIISPDQCFQ
jgi:hypothetical protein